MSEHIILILIVIGLLGSASTACSSGFSGAVSLRAVEE